ncbi:MAG: autotransporter domain-containing protein [Gammaproteobacteria bacterium]|nr:autotransporter domain-containing protein [Gammaproteobacteria bacterium]
MLSMLALSQGVMATDFTINTDVTTTNGGNTLDGNDSLTITGSGSIKPAGGVPAVDATGDNNTVANFGSISVTDEDAIEVEDKSIVTNTGSITAAGLGANGIVADHYNTITNSGSITTSGEKAHAIDVQEYNYILNTGSLSTTGEDADGIHTWGNSTVINTGAISTLDQGSVGIAVEDDSRVTNNGSISTEGSDGYGIQADGSNNTIINTGSISTKGDDGYGIFLEGNNNKATNTGIITTFGEDAEAVYFDGDNNTIFNTGIIRATGEQADGIAASGSNSTINNAGLISATGTGIIYAVSMRDNSTLNLLSGSRVIGPIDLDEADVDGNDTVNIYGGSPSAQMTLTGADTINFFGAGIINGETVTTVDATAPSALGVASANLSNSVHGTVSQRMAYKPQLQPLQVASLVSAPGMLYQERKPVAWVQAFGGQRDYEVNGSVMAYDHAHYGFNVGYEWDTEERRVGVMAGFARSDIESEITSFDTESDNFFVGGYGHFNLGSVNLTASLIGGYSDYDNKRYVFDNINGLEKASADFDGYFLSPSVTFSASYMLGGGLELRPSVNLTYNVAWMDDYTESGTTSSNLSIDDRTARTLSSRLQLALAKQPNANSEVEFRVGLATRHSDDDNTHANLAGSTFTYSNVGDDDVATGYAGINYRIATKENLSLVVDIEAGASADESYYAGQLSLEYKY